MPPVVSHHARWYRHSHGITTVDAEYVRPAFASIHVVERGGRAGIIDTGSNHSVPLVLRALSELGLSTEAVDWVFLTHVHLDHAGGAGSLMQQLAGARAIVHPRGATHLIDPSRLESATIAVYGAEMFDRLYGRLIAIPQERVHQTRDGEALMLGDSELAVFHTPGHAMHHQVLFDEQAAAVFSGDTFGVAYRELETEHGAFIVPTTTPTQFDPEQLLGSIQRIVELGPEAVYLTHFGRVTGISKLATALREQIQRFVELASEYDAANDSDREQRFRSALRAYTVQRASSHGVEDAAAEVDTVLGADLELNLRGLIAWLDRKRKTTA